LKTVTKLDESSICDTRSVDNSIDTYDVKVELDCTSVNEPNISSDDTNEPNVISDSEDDKVRVANENSTVDTVHETNGGITDDNIMPETSGTISHDNRAQGIIAFGVKVEGATAEVIDIPNFYISGQYIYNVMFFTMLL